MAKEDLLKPVSEDQPVGPDLEAIDDDAFVEYYYEAESRLPERYFIPGSVGDGREDRLFDPRSIDLRAEQSAIDALLQRSRDLRLISLLARFQILAGRLPEFVDSLEAMAGMLAQWPQQIIPPLSGGTAERRSAIEALNSQPAVVAPLMHLALLPNADVSLRRYLVASGNAEPRLSEDGLAGSDQTEPLRSDANLRHVRVTQDLLTRAADALFRIQRVSLEKDGGAFNADLNSVRGVIADIQAMISTARPDVRGWSESNVPAPPPEIELPPVETVSDSGAEVPAAAAATAVPPRGVANRATAAVALDVAQAWLALNEPSSPALILVAQARQLVGAPLVEAIQVLMPDRANNAVLNIGQGSGFALDMNKLRELTKSGLENNQVAESQTIQPKPILQRSDLIAQLIGVEGYFTTQEPASPVPLLLAKARNMLDKRFDAIMAELFVPPVASV